MKRILIEKPGCFHCILKNETEKTIVFDQKMMEETNRLQLFLLNVERVMKTPAITASIN